jgi:hypothetical protein
MKGVSWFLIVTLALGAFLGEAVSGIAEGSGQRPRRRIPSGIQTRSARIDYSQFLHSTKQHQAACVTCHKIPTSNSLKVRGYPDVADYPGHDACVSCHRPQFFRGAKPPICSVCHPKVSPSDDIRFAYRNPAGKRQFQIDFPHDKHQDVIARLLKGFPRNPKLRFVNASLPSLRWKPQGRTPQYNNCEICHEPLIAPSIAPASGWTDGFVPDNLTLKSVPTSHASCFSCHWKSEQPVNENCAGCHKLPTPPAMIEFVDSPKRISMKFRHGREQHVLECTACHINITKSATVRGLKPDVPITSCSECHNKAPSHLEISNELAAIDKKRDFICVYCHTSDIGKLDPPSSHYLIAERPPIKRREVK